MLSYEIRSHFFGSAKASTAWYLFYYVIFKLWMFFCGRLCAILSFVRSQTSRCHGAVWKEDPKSYRLKGGEIANSHLQAAILSSTFLIPWPSAPLEMLARPLPANQIPWRRECSDGSYQVLVIKLNPGLVMLLNTPSRILRMRGDVKMEAAPWYIRIMD